MFTDMNNEDQITSEFVGKWLQPEVDKLEASVVKQPTPEQIKDFFERDRKICMGEWDGPETPYVKFVREFYKDKDWSNEN